MITYSTETRAGKIQITGSAADKCERGRMLGRILDRGIITVL